MLILILTLGVTAALMTGMAVGIIFGRKPLKGSCGGLGGSCACEAAGQPGACEDGKGPRTPVPPGELIGFDQLTASK